MVVYDRPGLSDPLDAVTSLTTSQIQQIYQAQDNITTLKWSDLNPSWPATNIIPRMREATSGTRGSFEALVPVDAAKDLATFNALNAAHGNAYPVLTGNPEMATAINGGSDQGAIGYVGLGFTAGENPSYPNVRALDVADTTHSPAANGGVATTPTTNTILNGSYALARDLYLYTTQLGYYNPNNIYIARYLRYIYSPAGQDAVVAAGFVRIDQNKWNVDAKGITDVSDVAKVAIHWTENTKTVYPLDAGNLPVAKAGVPGWARWDCNADGQVDVSDVAQIALHWGQA